METLRIEIRKLERVEEDNKTLEEANQQLIQEREAKEKDIKKLRQTLEVKESTLDEYEYVNYLPLAS